MQAEPQVGQEAASETIGNHGTEPLLRVENLTVTFGTRVRAVRGISFEVPEGGALALVGESGSGKSVSALAVLGLVPARIRGSIRLDSKELVGAPESELRRIRGQKVGMIFQDPLSSLNPALSIGKQLLETIGMQRNLRRDERYRRARELLEMVELPGAARRLSDYPHQLSGGMRQRVMIALALARNPVLLIADEPTTSLDVTIQAQILGLLQRLRRELQMALILITHDLAVAAGHVDRVAVMYSGRIVEDGPAPVVLGGPRHPYTSGLLASVPRIDGDPNVALVPIRGSSLESTKEVVGCAFRERCDAAVDRCGRAAPALEDHIPGHAVACWVDDSASRSAAATLVQHRSVTPAQSGASTAQRQSPDGTVTVLEALGLRVWYRRRRTRLRDANRWLRAVDDVTLELRKGETFALVGESGCGKSTFALALLGLERPTAGTIRFRGQLLSGQPRLEVRKRLQIIFQDPYSSLNPRHRIRQILSEPMDIHGLYTGSARRARLHELFNYVELPVTYSARYPHELSGGQRQRVAIARALATNPEVLVCDEPLSSLDVSVQAQIANLFRHLRSVLQLSSLFISHDLAVVRYVADRVAVMYAGKIVETGPSLDLYQSPQHPYTAALISAVPSPDAARLKSRPAPLLLSGDVSQAQVSDGCNFRPRCWLYERLGHPALCEQVPPALERRSSAGAESEAACHFSSEVALQLTARLATPTDGTRHLPSEPRRVGSSQHDELKPSAPTDERT